MAVEKGKVGKVIRQIYFLSRRLRGVAAAVFVFFFLLRLARLGLRSHKQRHRLVAELCRA